MYSKGKYVVGEILTNDIVGSMYGAIIVSEVVSHNSLRHCFVEGKIDGAGFFHIVSDKDGELGVSVYGESVGLNVKCRPDKDPVWIGRACALPQFMT